MLFYSSYDHVMLMFCSNNEFLKKLHVKSDTMSSSQYDLCILTKICLAFIAISMCAKVLYMSILNVGEGISSIKEG